MHDLLVALAFVSMVVAPAVVAALPLKEADEDGSDNLQETLKISAASPSRRG
jgi:hypothetical protein